MSVYSDILERNTRPMQPLPTDVAPRLTRLDDIQAVLLDIYGTLLISGSGDVGTAMQMAHDEALIAAQEACGISWSVPPGEILAQFYETIAAEHAYAKERGITYPEVVVEEIWQNVFQERLPPDELTHLAGFDIRRFALEFETRVNPVWPMPDLREVVASLQQRGLLLGIVSNAQFFTPVILEYFLQAKLEEMGFKSEHCFYSYQHRRAKPGVELYDAAAQSLKPRRIEPRHILYVGNDMLNDIQPAAQVGMKTALFAGDRRSLRLRTEDSRLLPIQPDVTLTQLTDIFACVPGNTH